VFFSGDFVSFNNINSFSRIAYLKLLLKLLTITINIRGTAMSKEKKKIFSISINPKLLKEIDQKRGLVKRSTFIEHLSKQGLRWTQLKPSIEDHCNKLLEILPERLLSPVEKRTPADAKKRIYDAREIVLEMKQLLNPKV